MWWDQKWPSITPGAESALCSVVSLGREWQAQGALWKDSVNILVGFSELWQHKVLPLQLQSNSQRQARKTGDSNYIKQTFSLSAETFGCLFFFSFFL